MTDNSMSSKVTTKDNRGRAIRADRRRGSEIRMCEGNGIDIMIGRGSHPTIIGGVVFVSHCFLSIPTGTDKHSFYANQAKNLLSLCRLHNKSIYLTQFKAGLTDLS